MHSHELVTDDRLGTKWETTSTAKAHNSSVLPAGYWLTLQRCTGVA